MATPKVFISYSREGPEHESWILKLATDLRVNGVEASLDKWDLRAGQDMTFFMESQIRDSDFVLLVCTPTYAQKSNIPVGGVGYEKNIISAEMLQSRDLKPKFIPLLRLGDFGTSLPTYLGSKFAVDFRSSRDYGEALDELLRAIHEVEPPSKPPIGRNPYAGTKTVATRAENTPKGDAGLGRAVVVSGHVESWEPRAHGRFDFLREQRLDKSKSDPFAKGYWHTSFALSGQLNPVTLTQFLELLRNSETGRTGWDVGWVPTKPGIAPYPFQDGIEVWLAETGGRGPSHSDFWRAEPIGTFALFRGYDEDEEVFKERYPDIQFDVSLVLWRVAEVLLYLESFSEQLAVLPVSANIRFRWTALENRRLGSRNSLFWHLPERICHQSTVESSYHIQDTSQLRKTLIGDVQKITRPLFETFDFFSVSDAQVKSMLKGLFGAEKEGR